MPVMAASFYDQQAYRFYYDDGSESANNAAAAQNTAYGVTISGAGEGKIILRIGIAETGGSTDGNTTDDWQLQVSKNGGAFANVTTSSSNVIAFNSANLTDAGATTQRLTGLSGTFGAGKISEDGLADDVQILLSSNTELVYAIQPVFANLANGDALTFRVLCNGAVLDLYSQTPTMNITIATMGRNAQTTMEVFADSPAASARIGQATMEVFADSPAASARVAQMTMEIFATAPSTTARMGDIVVEIMASVTNITRPTRRASAGLSAF